MMNNRFNSCIISAINSISYYSNRDILGPHPMEASDQSKSWTESADVPHGENRNPTKTHSTGVEVSPLFRRCSGASNTPDAAGVGTFTVTTMTGHRLVQQGSRD
jgi:hypothetical protein